MQGCQGCGGSGRGIERLFEFCERIVIWVMDGIRGVCRLLYFGIRVVIVLAPVTRL